MALARRWYLLVALASLPAACSYSGSPGGASVSSMFPLEHLKTPLLPPGSELLKVAGDRLHVRRMGSSQPGPLLVMLSGPTDSWHSDSAWFAALQPLLARSQRTVLIDRAGQGFSEGDGGGGYQAFARQLSLLLPQLSEEPVVVIAFASANLALHHYFSAHPDGGRIAGALLLDPDALHPELVEFYAAQAVPFQDPGLRRYVRAGNYDQRAQQLLEADRAHALSLLSGQAKFWFEQRYFERVLETRLQHEKIIARFTEIARYDQDVRGAALIAWPPQVRVWSVDTDFELAAVESATDPAEAARYLQWYELSSAWMLELPGGCRIHSESREHLLPMAAAETISELALALSAGASCPSQRWEFPFKPI